MSRLRCCHKFSFGAAKCHTALSGTAPRDGSTVEAEDIARHRFTGIGVGCEIAVDPAGQLVTTPLPWVEEGNALVIGPSQIRERALRCCEMHWPRRLHELAELRISKRQVWTCHIDQIRKTSGNAPHPSVQPWINSLRRIFLRQAGVGIQRGRNGVTIPHSKGTQDALGVS